MGRHTVPDAPPPPKSKPAHRFMLAMGGIVLLAIVAMAIVAAIYPEKGPVAGADAIPDTTAGAVGEPVGPPITVPPPAGSPTAPINPGQPPGPPPTTVPTTPGTVTAGYAVTHDDKEWGDRFEVRINLHNTSAVAQQWVLTLTYPQRVSGIAAAWIEGHPPPSQAPNRPTFTLSSTEAIPPGGSMVLWAQLTLDPGSGVAVSECRINATPCDLF